MALFLTAGDGGGGGGGAGGNGGTVILCTTLESKKNVIDAGNLVIQVTKGSPGEGGDGGSNATTGTKAGSDANSAGDGLQITVII